jgi:hypothetical protein
MAGSVRAAVSRPFQTVGTKPEKPASTTVGTSGRSTSRRSDTAASNRIRLVASCSFSTADPPHTSCTSLRRRAVMCCGAPGNVTPVIETPKPRAMTSIPVSMIDVRPVPA